MLLRSLKESGQTIFETYLDRAAEGSKEEPPFYLLQDDSATTGINGKADIQNRSFRSRLDAAGYLSEALRGVARRDLDTNHGLWTWLALFYFDQLCPRSKDGVRHPGEGYRYIHPRIGSAGFFRHYYRHLVAGPYRIFRLHGERARVLLHAPVHTHGDFSEQLGSRAEFITNGGLINAADLLYFDESVRNPKRGATNRKRPGTLRRFISVVQQLDVTYDLYSMTGSQIVSLLPPEFGVWLDRGHTP